MQSRQPCRLGDASQVAPGAQPALPRGAAVRAPGRSRWQSAKAPGSKGPSAQSGASVVRASLRVWPCAPALYPRMDATSTPHLVQRPRLRGGRGGGGDLRRVCDRCGHSLLALRLAHPALRPPLAPPPACSPPGDIVLVRTTALPRQAANAPWDFLHRSDWFSRFEKTCVRTVAIESKFVSPRELAAAFQFMSGSHRIRFDHSDVSLEPGSYSTVPLKNAMATRHDPKHAQLQLTRRHMCEFTPCSRLPNRPTRAPCDLSSDPIEFLTP